MNGEAQKQIEDYMAEEHTFKEFCEVHVVTDLNTRI